MPKHPPLGFTFAGVPCGLKKTGAADFALIASDRPCAAAAVFTRNKFAAAPVIYDRALVAENPAGLAAVAINSGCANACTGDAGLADATAMAAEVETALGLPARSCAVMSTGVIGVRLDMSKIAAGVRLAAPQLAAEGWDAASRAIMTTDTRPKVAFRRGRRRAAVRHGEGRRDDPSEHGDHALDDRHGRGDRTGRAGCAAARGGRGQLQQRHRGRRHLDQRHGAGAGERRVGRDGERASGEGENGGMGEWENAPALPLSHSPTLSYVDFAAALTSLCTDLAQQIARDGEGATKFITVRVEGAASDADARAAAKAVANSPLVKTAFYGGDANWGRILCAVGYSDAAVDPARADLWIAAGRGEVTSPLQLVANGQPLAYSEEAASAIFAEKEIVVEVKLGLGDGQATVWTCDLSHEYVDINGHYRT